MAIIGERVQQRRDQLGMSQGDLGKLVGVSQQAINLIEIGKTKNPRYIIGLSRALRVSPDWLQGMSEDIDESGGPARYDTSPHPSSPDIASIPEIDIYAGMGGGGVYSTECNQTDEFGNTIAADNVRHLWDLPVNYVRYELRVSPEKASIIEVKGDSMAPTLTSGDRVMIDTSDTSPTPPGLFAVWDGTGVVVKRVEPVHRSDPPAIRLISDNEKHQPYECTTEEARIIGRVIWFARRV